MRRTFCDAIATRRSFGPARILVPLLAVVMTCPLAWAQNEAAQNEAADDAAEAEVAKSDAAETTDADEAQRRLDLEADVLEWVDQLDAASLAKRKSAEKSLIDAGPDALEFLPESKSGVSIEATERLARVRKALKAMRTEQETKASPNTIDLSKVSTLEEALEAISRDSGIEFQHESDGSTAISPVAAPLSFWHAVDLVLDQADLDINFYGGDRTTLQLVAREADRPSRVDTAAYTGVYRIEPTSVTSRRSLNKPNLSALNVAVEISWEPRLTPIGLSIPIDQLTGKLDDDQSLRPQESGETIDVNTNSELAFSEFFMPMQLPAGQPDKVKALSGIIRALLPGKRQKFELPIGKPSAKKKIDSMTVEIESVRKNGPLHQVRVGITLEDADRSLESHRHWIFENDAFIKRKDGTRTDHLGFEVYRQAESGVGVSYLFDLGDAVDDMTLIYESPTAVVPNEVPFVIQDIPLP